MTLHQTATEPSSDGPDLSGSSAVRRFLAQPVSVASLGFIALLSAGAVLAPVVAPHDPNATDVLARLQGPSAEHWLGTDDVGRDIATRALYGARVALSVSLRTVALAAAVGIPLGLVVAYVGGWWERVLMRLADMQQAIPMLLLAFTFAGILGTGLTSAMLAVGISFALQYVRITRAAVLRERERPYVDAAVVQGFPVGRILFRHILPNATAPLVIQTSIVIGVAILVEATLSFLGLGVDTRTPSWGGMLEEARRFQTTQPLLSVVPGALVTLTVLAFNMLGDGIAEATGRRRAGGPRRTLRRHPVGLAPVGAGTPRVEVTDVDTDGGGAHAPGAATPDAPQALLQVDGLQVVVDGPSVSVPVVRGISFAIAPGETFGLVGESGSGKSMTASAVIGMVPPPARTAAGRIVLAGRDLSSASERQWAAVRGKDVGVVFQDPMAALSPVHTVGEQIIESLRVHEGMNRRQARERAAELLGRVGVPDPVGRLDDYPHQFSGGMAQRAMIASALACRPRLLIADEPTTALDATVQRQVLTLLAELRDELGMSVLFISHDLAVVAEVCDRVAVMRDGVVVETGRTADVLAAPAHEYTRALLEARRALAPGRPLAPTQLMRSTP